MERLKSVRLWLAAAFVLTSLVSIGMASSLSVTSSNLTSYRTCVIQGYPLTATAESDAMVEQENPATNYGTATTMDVASETFKIAKTGNHRSYIQFALSTCTPAIASTASVKIATLRVMVAALAGSCRTEDVYRVTSAWTETAITWNTPPTNAATATSSVNVGSAPCANSTANAYVNIDVTADVAAFVAGTATNFGWMLRDHTESSGSKINSYFAKDLGILGSAPQLVVNYR